MDIVFKPVQNGFLGHYRNVVDKSMATPLHYHDCYELYYLLNGRRNYLTHSKIYPLDRDWITMTKPYVIHGTNGHISERLLINFSEEFLSTYFAPATIDFFKEVFVMDTIPAETVNKTPLIKDLFYQIEKEFTNNKLGLAAMHLGELLFLLHETVQQSPDLHNHPNLPTQMQNILTYISENLSTVTTLEQVANHFYISKYYLAHQFRTNTGFTFIEFLTKVKISRALQLLEHTNDSITSISDECGFATPTYFGVVFKKKMHMTPLQYRAWIAKQTSSSQQHN